MFRGVVEMSGAEIPGGVLLEWNEMRPEYLRGLDAVAIVSPLQQGLQDC